MSLNVFFYFAQLKHSEALYRALRVILLPLPPPLLQQSEVKCALFARALRSPYHKVMPLSKSRKFSDM